MQIDKEKQKRITLKGLFRNTAPVEKEKDSRPSMSLLKKMATTRELRDVLKKIEYETIPTVRNAWIDYFLEVTKRPKYSED
jgi:hypothetical protein